VLRRTRVLGGSSIDNDGAFLAMAYAKLNEPEKATRWFRAVEGWMALFSGNTRFYAEAAETLGVTPQPPKSRPMTIENEQRAAQLAIEADPAESRWVHAWLADRAAARGEWQAASEGFGLAIAQTPDEAYLHYKRAIVQLKAGDPSGFRSSCAAIVERFSQSADPEALHWLAWTCSLAPDALETWNVPLEAAGRRQDDGPDPGIYLLGLGALQYRAGRFDDAASRLREARDALKLKPSEKTSLAYATLFLSMAQARLGHDEESRKWLAQAKAEIELEGPDSMSWNRRATMDLLQAEAERLLATTP
jgi:tetratricopeptide (TPR) repeat protein